MKKRRLLQSDVFWGLAAGFLVLLQFWWLPGEDGSVADSYSTTTDGKLGLFRTLSELFPHVERDAINVVPQFASSLLIIAPDRYPNSKEQQQLFEFVYNGGRLLFTPNAAEATISIPSLGIDFSRRPWSVSPATPAVPAAGGTLPTTPVPATPMPETSVQETPVQETQLAENPVPQPSVEDSGAADATDTSVAPSNTAGVRGADESLDSETHGETVDATSQLVQGPIQFRSTSLLRVPDYFDSESLVVSASGNVEAATWSMGNGRVVVCSSSDIFSNRSMLYPDSRRLAVRIVERCAMHESERTISGDGWITLSEYFNASDAFQQTGILFSPTLRIGTLQLLLVAVLGIWLAFYRFGPATEETTLQRRSLTESAQAVGNLQYRLRDGGAVVRSYLDYMRSQLRRRYGSFLRLDDPDAIANRSGLDRTEVSDQLREANAMANSTQLSPVKAAAMLRWLSALQQRLGGTRGGERGAGNG